MADIPKSVVQKLVFYTAAMILFPISTFFIVQYITGNNALISGGVSALMANVVLIGYVVAAFTEDTRTEQEQQETKKDQ